MRILLINDYGTIDGGAEVIVLGLRDALRARGHDVRLFTTSAGSNARELHADTSCFGTKSGFRTAVQCLNVSAIRGIREVLRNFRPDVIHVNLYLTQLSPWILREFGDIPAIYYAQWYRAICPLGTRRLPSGATCERHAGTACLGSGCLSPWDWPLMSLQMQLDRAWGNRFTKVAAISQAVALRLQQFGAPHLDSPTVIYPGTPVVAPRTEMSTDPVVLAAGRLVPEKGFETLIRGLAAIAKSLPGSRLILLGEGPQQSFLQQLTGELGVSEQVQFLGHRSHADTQQLIRTAWVSCVPSLWEEPLGMMAIESQMHGVAVLASAVGGLVETLADGETGMLVPPGDVSALAAALRTLLSDRERTYQFGRRGHVRVKELFGLDGAAARFEAFYRQTIDSQGQPPR